MLNTESCDTVGSMGPHMGQGVMEGHSCLYNSSPVAKVAAEYLERMGLRAPDTK